jgi:hypothetical protein
MLQIMKRTGILTTILVLCQILNAQQLPNPSFENWDILTDSSPHDDLATSWNTVNSSLDAFTAGTLGPTCYQSTDFFTGAFSIYLVSVSPPFPTFPVVNGIATTGTINTSTYDVEGGVAYTLRPDSLAGWYKSNPQAGDLPTIEVVLKDAANDTIGWARFKGPTFAVTTWTRFSVPVVYSSGAIPTQAASLLSASDGFNAVPGSELWVDDIELIFNPVSITEIEPDVSVFYNSTSNNVSWHSDLKVDKVEIIDLNGKLIGTFSNPTNQSANAILSTGVYVLRLKANEMWITKKLAVR